MRDFWARYRRNKGSVVGLVILVLVLALALAGPLLLPSDPWDIKGRPLLPPGSAFPWVLTCSGATSSAASSTAPRYLC